MDTSQMISSFTNLSQISQGEETNNYLKTLTEYTSAANNSQAVGFLGKTISYSSDKITVSEGTANNLSYTLGSDASDVSVTIYDTAGKAVRTVDLGSISAGTYSLKWDGTDSSGSTVDDGSYSFKFSANDNAGNSLTVSSSAVGTSKVSGIVYKDGVSYLVTDQGEISVGSVTKVT
jgi:flagellar basal-body rod modification protein FlgD